MGMNPQENETMTLDKLAMRLDSTYQWYTCFTGWTYGHPVVTMELPINTFHTMSIVPNTDELGLAQRKHLDVPHAKKLSGFFLKGAIDGLWQKLEELDEKDITDDICEIKDYIKELSRIIGTQPFYAVQPFTGSLPSAGRKGSKLTVKEVSDSILQIKLGCRDLIRILDGFHRKHGIIFLLEELDYILDKSKFMKKGSLLPFGNSMPVNLKAFRMIKEYFLTSSTVSVRIYLGLTLEQERQVFHDINRLGKTVDDGLAFIFDSSNPIVLYAKDALARNIITLKTVDHDQKRTDDDDTLSMRDLVNVCTIFFTGKTSNKGAPASTVREKEVTADRLWRTIHAIPNFGNRKATVAMQGVVMKAIARLAFDLGYGRNKDADQLENFLTNLVSKVDFSHENKIWQYYNLPEDEKKTIPGIEAFVPETMSSPLGVYSPSYGMRFAATSNDVFPVIGDMIRYQIGLQPRKRNQKKGSKEEVLLAGISVP